MTSKILYEKIDKPEDLKPGDFLICIQNEDRFQFIKSLNKEIVESKPWSQVFRLEQVYSGYNFHVDLYTLCSYYMKEVKMEEENKEKEAEKIKMKVSPLYDGMSVSAFYSDENSLKRIFDICYHFAEAFGGHENLYILPFMMGKTPAGKSYVDIHFWVNTDTLLKESNFATEAEWWINGYLAGVENR